MHIITLESCHSTWIFDPRQLRFCRILRGIAVGRPRISTEWRPYWHLEIDPHGRNFTVYLNEARTRLVRSSLHTPASAACAACGASHTTELSLEEISRSGGMSRPPCRADNVSLHMDDSHARVVEEATLLLDARQELYGASDPLTFDAMLQLGRALRDAGELRQAERVLTSSLSLQNRSPDVDGVRVRWTEFNLAIVLDRLGEHEATRRLWERVLASSDRDDGIDSELSRQTAANLAITLRKLRRYGDEFPLRVRVLESARRATGADSAETVRAEIDLAQTHRHLGNHELALGLFTDALDRLERNGGDQRTILLQKWAIATELVALKRSKEAASMFDQVVAGAIEHLDPDDPFRKSAIRQRRGYSLLGTFSGLGRKARRTGNQES